MTNKIHTVYGVTVKFRERKQNKTDYRVYVAKIWGSRKVFLSDSVSSNLVSVTVRQFSASCHPNVTNSNISWFESYIVIECVHNAKDSVKAAIMIVLSSTGKNKLMRVCCRLRNSIETTIVPGDGFTE